MAAFLLLLCKPAGLTRSTSLPGTACKDLHKASVRNNSNAERKKLLESSFGGD